MDNSPPERPYGDDGRRWINGQPLPNGLWLVEEGYGRKPKVFWPVLLDYDSPRKSWRYLGSVSRGSGYRKGYFKASLWHSLDITAYFTTIEAAVHFLIFVAEHYYGKTS